MKTRHIEPNGFYILADGTLVRVQSACAEQRGKFWVWEMDSQEPHLVAARDIKTEDRPARDAWAARHAEPKVEPEECEDNACAGCAWCNREVGQ